MSSKPITFDRFVRGTLITIAVAVLLYIMNLLSSILLPFFLGWVIAFLLYPMVRFVQYRMRVKSRVLSILISLIFVIAVISGILYLIVPSIISQFERLGELVTSYLHEVTNVKNFPEAIKDWLKTNTPTIQSAFENEKVNEAFRKIAPQLVALITKTANVIINIIASLMTLVYAFFILIDYEILADGFIRIFPKKSRPFWKSLISDVDEQLNNYIRGQGTVALCIGVLFCIGLTIIGFPMAIGMGILIGVLSLIPYLHGLALIPIVFLSLLKAADTGQNFWIILGSALLVFIIVQIISDTILTPKIMGKAMNLNPAILLLALSVWGTLLGFIGLIIALPLTTLIITYYKRYVTKEDTITTDTDKCILNDTP